jgi:hypothetical protein
MADKMYLSISEIDSTLLNGFPELLNTDCQQSSFTLPQADGELLPESHLVF